MLRFLDIENGVLVYTLYQVVHQYAFYEVGFDDAAKLR